MNAPTKAERIAFWQQSYARASFVHARLYIELLLNSNPPTDSTLRRALTAAILVAYSGPFKQRKQVRLPDDIVPPEHRDTHNAMIELRDKVVAHRDLDGPVAEWGFVSQLQLKVRAKELTVDTRTPCITNEKATECLPLIKFLIAEMLQGVAGFVILHLKNIPVQDASYVVSLDDTPPQWLIHV